MITVVGSFVMDNVATMKRFPEAGETVLGERLGVYPGGKGINQCVAARRLGAETAMVGMLGKDGNGEAFRALMRAEGIAAEKVFESAEAATGTAQVQIEESGQNRICVLPGANYRFGIKELEEAKETITKAEIVLAQLEIRMEVTERLSEMCEEAGVALMLNPAPAAELPERLLKRVTYLTPNEKELEKISGMRVRDGEEAKRAAEALVKRGVKNVIATMGSRGALISNGEGSEAIAGYKVTAVDTVAAGDSFNGALAYGITKGKSLRESVKIANAVGALTVTKKGAVPSLPYLREVLDFLKTVSC